MKAILQRLLILCALIHGWGTAIAAEPDAAPARHVTGGDVRGEDTGDLVVFKGIPFAAPPIGDNRWRDPRPVKKWDGVRAANAFAPACMQPALPFGGPLPVSEDCLYLNVWAPKSAKDRKLPVMVWIYGGGFKGGATRLSEMSALARKGVVVVSIGYRVGGFGFLAHPELTAEAGHGSGNYGLSDQIAGLEWVKANIEAFGGDSRNVTLFGESAGSFSVSMLAASPRARGLFHKGIAQSGASFAPVRGGPDQNGLLMRSLTEAEQEGASALRSLGATDIVKARLLPAEKIVSSPVSWWPIVDGFVVVGDQHDLYRRGRFNDVPIIVGSNADEGSLFVQKANRASFDKMIAEFGGFKPILEAYPHANEEQILRSMRNFYRDGLFGWPAWTWARLQSGRPSARPVYLYYFDHPDASFMSIMKGPTHAAEIPYVLGTVPNPKPDDRRLSDLMMSYWVNFARTGNPNGPGLPQWPQFTPRRGEAMYLNARAAAGPVPNLQQLRAMDEYFAWRRSRPSSR